MILHFVPTEFLLSQHHWLSAEELTEQIVSSSIKAALESGGLLTTALQKAYRQPAFVECRRQVQWTDAETVLGLRRDVLINVGETPRVAAATLMPQNVLNLHPWLATMGNNPLGEMLETHARYQRGAFAFTQLDAKLIFHPAPCTATLLWARRYRFSLEGGDLLVTEIFLPGVLDRLGNGFSVNKK